MMYIFIFPNTQMHQAVYGCSVADARTRLQGRNPDLWIFKGSVKLEEFSCTFLQGSIKMTTLNTRAAMVG
ncbi:MAG: hypothetical protein AAFQ01_04900 [Bacteroidota bacterium]